MNTLALKNELRRQVGKRLSAMTDAHRHEASSQARSRLAQQKLWQQAHSILFFAPLPRELDIWPLLETALSEGKTVGLPRFDPALKTYRACRIQHASRDVQIGNFGIREPGPDCGELPAQLDVILVPGIAFDLTGRRLGRGKGFYDRLLAGVRGTTCAVAFDEQIVDEVPVEPHDVHLDYILTPTRWIEL
jgi:5-formyltetrahydrofolate cyclo-ligase